MVVAVAAAAPAVVSFFKEVVSATSGTYEFVIWNDGSLNIEDAMYQFDGDVNRDHVALPVNVARVLRTFLNSERVGTFLDNPQPIGEGMHQAGEYAVSGARFAYYELREALNYDFTVGANGSLVIEHLLWSLLVENELDHAEMQLEQARDLREFLNRDDVMAALGIQSVPDIVA